MINGSAFFASALLAYATYIGVSGRWTPIRPAQLDERPRWLFALWASLSICIVALIVLRSTVVMTLPLPEFALPIAGLSLTTSLCLAAATSLIYRARIRATHPSPQTCSIQLAAEERTRRQKAERHLLQTYENLKQSERRVKHLERDLAARQRMLMSFVRSIEADKRRNRALASRDARELAILTGRARLKAEATRTSRELARASVPHSAKPSARTPAESSESVNQFARSDR